MTTHRSRILLALSVSLIAAGLAAAEWQPAAGQLMTKWAKDVSPEKAHVEYPRPQLVRKDWLNLNGLWDYAIRPMSEERPQGFDGKILVPFPVESALSGVMKRVAPESVLWYRRGIQLPEGWEGRRVLIHFGAVDWHARVWVNGQEVGEHKGGYDPFSFDITAALGGKSEGELLVSVADPTDGSFQPRGKQIRNPHGIWYTPTTGIWQTAWLEPVPEAHIRSLKLIPDVDNSQILITVETAGTGPDHLVDIELKSLRPAMKVVAQPGKQVSVRIPEPRLWTPDDPHLYDVDVQLAGPGAVGAKADRVSSYFGMRKVSLGKTPDGILRILLNNRFVFQYGPLDQGFWPDGLYTAPNEEALRYDLEVTKRLGFNMVRKHVKVEPAIWYHACDRMGLLVWQDMPSGDRYIGGNDPDITRSPESAAQFETEWKRIIDAFRNHPSIVMWVPFNEGWGQFDTARIVKMTQEYDPTRLVNEASGWTDRGSGDVKDVHIYPGPGAPRPEEKRAIVLGEFGGLGLPLKGHTWQEEKNWGYRSFKTQEELNEAYLGLMANLRPLVWKGLSAAVYTQTTDVEVEVNGFMSYDRAVLKIDADRAAEAHRRLHLPPPEMKTAVPTSEEAAQTWRFTLEKPADGWEKPEFDAASWNEGPGGFGTEGTPGSKVRTRWDRPAIWLRRVVDLPAGGLRGPHLVVHHDEDAEVYVNGQLAARLSGYTTGYVLVPVTENAHTALRSGGKTTIAVHCRQTGGGQYIDVGIIEAIERK